MRTQMSVRRMALAAMVAGSSLGAAGLIAAPGQALAATKAPVPACSDIYGSGSTLQTNVQQQGLDPAAPAGAFTSKVCSNSAAVHYNSPQNQTAHTGSGAGLAEFALQAHSDGSYSLDPTYAANGSFLDSFIGTDDPPTSSQLSHAASTAGTDAETVPVLQAPIAVIVNLPAGCTIGHAPTVTDSDLAAAFDDGISWNTLLTDAGAKPSGCSTTATPTVEVRSDNSGTSYAFKQYLSQINNGLYGPYVADQPTWPGTVSTTHNGGTANQGSGGEADAVNTTQGSIGYVNTADAASSAHGSFGAYAGGSTHFWVAVQNNYTSGSAAKVKGSLPASGTKALCPTTYSGALPGASDPDYENTHVANPDSVKGYPVCTLTYDVAWNSYSTVNGDTAANGTTNLYTGKYTGETPAAVAHTTNAFLGWVVGKGAKSLGSYYNALPKNIATLATQTVTNYVGVN